MKRILSLVLALVLLMATPALAEIKTLENPTLLTWATAHVSILQTLVGKREFDYAATRGGINYDPSQVRMSSTGKKVADGGCDSVGGTFSMGVGAGITDEDLWYVSFTFTPDTEPFDVVINVLTALMAAQYIGLDFGDGEEGEELLNMLTGILAENEENVAFEMCDMVLFTKLLPGGQRIVGINSLPFYNEFYKGSIAEYYQLN